MRAALTNDPESSDDSTDLWQAARRIVCGAVGKTMERAARGIRNTVVGLGRGFYGT